VVEVLTLMKKRRAPLAKRVLRDEAGRRATGRGKRIGGRLLISGEQSAAGQVEPAGGAPGRFPGPVVAERVYEACPDTSVCRS